MVKYRSPYHFLPPDATQLPLDPIVIQRAKKKLLAEIELNDQQEGDFTKNDLLQWFDHLKAEELLYHKYIYDHPSLLHFLEEGKLSDTSWAIALPDEPSLQHFILALVEFQFDQLFADAFRAGDVQRIQQLAALPLPHLEKRGRHYYTSTLQLLTSYYHQLLQLTKDWTPDQEAALREFMAAPFFLLFPYLPSYFQAMRDEFALTLIRFAEEPVDDKFKLKKLAKDIAVLSTQLGASPAAEEVINRKKSRLLLDHPAEPDTTGKKKGKGCLMWIIIIIVLLNILRAILSVI